MEDENDDPVGSPDPKDPMAEFRVFAEEFNLIRAGDPLDDNFVQAFYALVERCASVADSFGAGDGLGSGANAIRAKLGQE